jgi:small Trp-rich protein
MLFVLCGVTLVGLKLAGIGVFAGLAWWVVLLPFVFAWAWWQFSDMTGRTKRLEMDKIAAAQAARRQRSMESLGLGGDAGKPGAKPQRDQKPR